MLYAPPSKSNPRDPNSDPFHFLFTKLNHVRLDRVPPRHATESAFAAPFDQPWQSPLGTQHDTLPMISTPEMIQLCSTEADDEVVADRGRQPRQQPSHATNTHHVSTPTPAVPVGRPRNDRHTQPLATPCQGHTHTHTTLKVSDGYSYQWQQARGGHSPTASNAESVVCVRGDLSSTSLSSLPDIHLFAELPVRCGNDIPYSTK